MDRVFIPPSPQERRSQELNLFKQIENKLNTQGAVAAVSFKLLSKHGVSSTNCLKYMSYLYIFTLAENARLYCNYTNIRQPAPTAHVWIICMHLHAFTYWIMIGLMYLLCRKSSSSSIMHMAISSWRQT